MKNALDENIKLDVSIVIVTMNHLAKLKNLLKSIDKISTTNFTFEIVLIDNCSNDGTIQYINNEYPTIVKHFNSQIHGFAYNNNLGASLAKGNYIFICNPDIILLDNSLEKILNFAKKNPGSGIVCPQLLNSDLTYQPSIRKFHSAKILLSRLMSGAKDNSTNKTVNDYLLKDFDKNEIQPVDWALGAAMILKKDIYDELGGFDENFFLYVEDEDLCLRAWKANYQVTYYPNAVMIHDHQRSSTKKINKLTWFHFKSLIYFIRKHRLLINKLDRNNLS